MYLIQFGLWVGSHFSDKLKKMWKGEQDAVRILQDKLDPNVEYIWFHAASLGEFEQGRPLIEKIKQDYPYYKILLTFFSPSGYEVRKDYPGADIITYLPIDTISNARKFLRTIRPVMAFFIKYEFWYNYLHILQHRGVPTYSVSSIFRPNQIFFKFYGIGYKRVLRCFSHFFVQNEESRELLASIGIEESTVVGDTRFDRVLQIKEASKQLPVVESFAHSAEGTSPLIFVAGSSWPPDETIIINYLSKHPQWKLIMAPHVISEEHLRQIAGMLAGKKVVRYTQVTAEEASTADVLIIDCYGLLSSIYHYGDVAYVGGGFGAGIHNVLEAAVWDIPVIFGPNNLRFAEAQGLKKAGGGFEFFDKHSFTLCMDKLEKDTVYRKECGKLAGEYVESLAGASEKILRKISL